MEVDQKKQAHEGSTGGKVRVPGFGRGEDIIWHGGPRNGGDVVRVCAMRYVLGAGCWVLGAIRSMRGR